MPAFRELIAQEHELLGCATEDGGVVVSEPGASGEPRVVALGADLFGVAISGGGIRSATFNLGMLQALAEIDLLKHIDYLATVSGGGYTGGWWSAWRHRAGPGQVFPTGTEAEYELRHLREYSRYLAPRWGIGDLESWLFVATAASILLPALLASAAFVALAFLTFHLLAEVLVFAPWETLRAAGTGVFTYAVVALYDHRWQRRTGAERSAAGTATFHALTLLGSLSAAAFTLVFAPRAPFADQAMFLPIGAGAKVLAIVVRPAWCWLATYAVLAGLRFVCSRAGPWPPSVMLRGKLERVNARLFTLACAWTALSLLWEGGRWLSSYPMFAIATEPLLIGVAYIVFWTWRSANQPPNVPRSPGLLQNLRDAVPLLLAYATLITALVTVVSLLIRARRDLELSPALVVAIAGAGVLLTVLLFDTSESGLHSAVRARMARAYLGSRPTRTRNGLAPNRAVEPQPHDDFPVANLRGDGKPLHLVCCAANDLSGDPLANLNRGARSASLSALGLAIGDRFVPWGRNSPTFGSLLVASAAAFNPNMGAVSMRTGPVVRFLATALNLRLGLWLPAVTGDRATAWIERWLPGRLFYAELLGLTRADLTRHVHLSDGGHFDNSGIYELVRRRCRFILLSDCGQDLAVAFDDVGNSIRKVRQDFGIEIRIDLEALRPDAHGISRQHVAVGEIEYGPDDLGMLIVLKPTLTGDEPVDLQQYKSRNARFPHESTGNQFYDAAQWESYRRLGYHATFSAFAVVLRMIGERSVPRVFAAMRARWYPTPGDLTKNLLDLTQRFSAFENRVRESAPLFFQLELFPELREVARDGDGAPSEPSLAQRQQVIALLVQFTQLMEDVWLGCRLDTLWSHPLNTGWMSYFHRWTSTPSFRMWWPILRPLFSRGLLQFARERFGLPSPTDDLAAPDTERRFGVVEPLTSGFGERLASRGWLDAGLPPPRPDQLVYQYLLHLRPKATDEHLLQAAIVVVTPAAADGIKVASWQSRHFFVAPSLRGAGLERAFLHELLVLLEAQGFAAFRVELPEPDDADAAAQRARRDLVEFYAREGYVRQQGAANLLALRR